MRVAPLAALFAFSVACTSATPKAELPNDVDSLAKEEQKASGALSADCEGFPDLEDDAEGLGVNLLVADEATKALKCAGRLPGYSNRCPQKIDSKSGQPLCPENATKIEYPGQQVECGSCVASRAEMLVFGVHMLADMDTMMQIQGCASEGRCEGWKLCAEAGQPDFHADHLVSSYVGWAIAPERGFFRGDGQAGPHERRACRPHDAALWIEAAMVFARMSAHSELGASAKAIALARDYDQLAAALQPGCSLAGLEAGGQWWIPATVSLNNHGLFCMPQTEGDLRTANICGTERLSDCHATRATLATIAARMRGDIPPESCLQIDTQKITCEQQR